MIQFFNARLNRSSTLSSLYFCASKSNIPACSLKQRNVVCTATVDSHDVPITGTQLKVSALNILLKNKEEFVKLQSFVEQVESKPGKYGAGLLGYVGTTNPEGTVFLGSNSKTD